MTTHAEPQGPAHEHAVREAVTMALYLAIVLLALEVGFGGGDDGPTKSGSSGELRSVSASPTSSPTG